MRYTTERKFSCTCLFHEDTIALMTKNEEPQDSITDKTEELIKQSHKRIIEMCESQVSGYLPHYYHIIKCDSHSN